MNIATVCNQLPTVAILELPKSTQEWETVGSMNRRDSSHLSLNMKIGKRVQRIRRKAKLTQKAFGAVLEVSPSTVSRIERGLQSLNTLHLFTIVQRFDVTFKAFLKGL